jgi:hypothetical protein
MLVNTIHNIIQNNKNGSPMMRGSTLFAINGDNSSDKHGIIERQYIILI